MFIYQGNSKLAICFHRLNIILGCICILNLSYVYLQRKKTSEVWYIKNHLSDTTFFIYCYHGIFSLFLSKFVLSMGLVTNNTSAIFLYLIIVLILVLIGILFYYSIKIFSPGFLNLIIGGR